MSKEQSFLLGISRDERLKHISTELADMGISFSSSEEIGQYLERTEEAVQRVSVRVCQTGWIKSLVFYRSRSGRKEQLERVLRMQFLGVGPSTCAPICYHITGKFDFLIPMHVMSLRSLNRKIEDFGCQYVDLIDDMRVYIDASNIAAESEPLITRTIAYTEAMIGNAQYVGPQEIDSPRHRVYAYFNRQDGRGAEAHNIEQMHEINPPEVVRTMVLSPEALIHVFIKFTTYDKDGFICTLGDVQKVLSKGRGFVTVERYEPITESAFMCIIATDSFKTLRSFVQLLDLPGVQTEMGLILGHHFLPGLRDSKLRCKPCIHMVDSRPPCDLCPNYIQPVKENVDRDVDIGIPDWIGKFRVALIQLKVTEEERKRDSYAQIIQEKVLSRTREAIKNRADIVLFSELIVPRNLLVNVREEVNSLLKHEDRNKPLILVVGSDFKLDEDGNYYNVAPILIFKGGDEILWYEQYKNNIHPYESSFFSQIHSEGVLKEGCGWLRFTNTGFGDFSLALCFDHSDFRLVHGLSQKLDILLVSSWTKDKKALRNRLQHTASENYWFLLFVNNGLFGGSRLFGPFDGKTQDGLLKKTLPEGDEIAYFDLDVGELDSARRNPGHRGKEYVYADDSRPHIFARHD